MDARFLKSILLLLVIIISAVILSIFSYNYFTQSSTKIQSLAVRELETNSEIEAFSISNGLESALYTIQLKSRTNRWLPVNDGLEYFDNPAFYWRKASTLPQT